MYYAVTTIDSASKTMGNARETNGYAREAMTMLQILAQELKVHLTDRHWNFLSRSYFLIKSLLNKEYYL